MLGCFPFALLFAANPCWSPLAGQGSGQGIELSALLVRSTLEGECKQASAGQ